MEFNILVYFAVFIINVVTITKGDGLKASLTFVIDDSASMRDDIDAVISKINQVYDAVLGNPSSPFGNLVSVTFNDPDVQLRAKTTYREEFNNALAGIETYGGGDCPEFSMTGILKALDASEPNSELYVFTDADAKDYERYEQVKSSSKNKSSQVSFVLTGMCGRMSDRGHSVYHDLADATGGQVFMAVKATVSNIIDYISERAKRTRAILAQKSLNDDEQLHFDVENSVDSIIVSVSCHSKPVGKSSFSIVDADGVVVPTEMVVNDSALQVVKFSPLPGSYAVKAHDAKYLSVQVLGSATKEEKGQADRS